MRDKKGFIIAMALVIAASLTLMVAAYSLSIFYRNQMYFRLINSARAYYTAASALGISNPQTITVTPEGDKVILTSETTGDGIRFRVAATTKGITRAIICERDAVSAPDGTRYFVTKWKGEQP